MATTEKSSSGTKPQKGGRKGGSLFPKLGLKQALTYSEKLVSKTHTGPQPEKTILPGVFNSAGNDGKIRASALKQFNLLEGTTSAYSATKLAKEISASLPDDSPPLLQKALLSPKVFAQIFDTFHGDSVSKAKIEQRAKGLGVHPESAEECAKIFIDSAITAGLGTVSGDLISLIGAGNLPTKPDLSKGDETENNPIDAGLDTKSNVEDTSGEDSNPNGLEKDRVRKTKPAISVNLTVDPSSDPDKLEKQLKLLRQYGVI